MDSQSPAGGLAEVADAMNRAIAGSDLRAIVTLLDDDVTWGDCRGRVDAERFLDAALGGPLAPIGGGATVVDGRIVATIAFRSESGEVGESHHAVFVADGRIVEICDAADPQQAVTLRPIGSISTAAARPARINGLAPVLAVSDITRAADHYRSLGFEVEPYEGPAAYGFASRDGVDLHLAEVRDLEPARNTTAVYLYVDDADALYAAWRSSGADGRLVAPADTDYGLREGAHIDPDGNLLRFGSSLNE